MPEKGQTESKAERRNRAYELRIAGLTYRQIGRELGVSHVTAFTYVKEELDALREECRELAETYRDMELERLDHAQKAIYAGVLKGDLGSIDRLLRIQERRSKLLGLDAPVKQDITQHLPEPIQFVPSEKGNDNEQEPK